MNVFIHYDEKTLNFIGSYGEEENTPSPYIPISIEEWNYLYPYGAENISVSKDLKYLIVDALAKTKQDTEKNNAIIKAQLSDIDVKSARTLRSVMSAIARGGIPDDEDAKKLAEYESQAAWLRGKIKKV